MSPSNLQQSRLYICHDRPSGAYCEYHDVETSPVDFASTYAVSEEFDGNLDVQRLALVDAVEFVLA